MTAVPLPDAWSAALPAGDNLVKRYTHGYADLMECMATALDWPSVRTDAFVAVDATAASEWLNVAVPLRPLTGPDADAILDDLTAFYGARTGGPFLVWCAVPVGDLSARGWTLMGHPPFMLRPAGPASRPEPDGLAIVEVTDEAALTDFMTTLVEAFPMPQLAGQPFGGFGRGLLDAAGWHMYLGRVDGRPVATAAAYVTDGHVDVEWVSTRPEHRGRRIGEAITWAATLADATKPAALIASDAGRPVYERMGYVTVTRFTLWVGARPR